MTCCMYVPKVQCKFVYSNKRKAPVFCFEFLVSSYKLKEIQGFNLHNKFKLILLSRNSWDSKFMLSLPAKLFMLHGTECSKEQGLFLLFRKLSSVNQM